MNVDKIMVALDYAHVEDANKLIEELHPYTPYVKVGMQLYYAAGPAFIYDLKEKGFRIFLDLKMHDIPNTVKGGAQSLAQLGVDIINVHCAGGIRMMEAALEGVEKGRSSSSASVTKVIGVTQLTSTSEQVMNEQIKIAGSLEEAIIHYAKMAKASGLHGVVCSAHEVPMIKENCGTSFITVTPGIRPSFATSDDQVRITTPKQAIELGTDYMVIGRAITKAESPKCAFEKIMEQVRSG